MSWKSASNSAFTVGSIVTIIRDWDSEKSKWSGVRSACGSFSRLSVIPICAAMAFFARVIAIPPKDGESADEISLFSVAWVNLL